jgi:hypothetical protein
MAGQGPAPAAAHTRSRNDKKSIRLIADGKTRGPVLPKNAIVDKDGQVVAWHGQTVRWWNHWRRSPQALRMLTEADWDFLLDTALMHHQMWQNGRWELAAEVRLRVQKFGATPEDRSRLGIEISSPTPGEANLVPTLGATVSSMASAAARRDRVLAEA